MPQVGLIGDPVAHSISPAMHNAAFQALGLNDWRYTLLPTPLPELPQRVASLRDQFWGANVTIPHKRHVIEYLDNVVLAARSIEAVNTIIREDDRLVGHNTDSAGFVIDLENHGVQIHGRNALVLGAGGAAHAAVLGLANRGATVTVMTRREPKGWDLRQRVKRGVSHKFKINVAPYAKLADIAPTVDLIVNTTPLGMHPNIDASIWPVEIDLPDNAVVYDMVYRPAETRLMKQAKEAGLTVIGGLGMLVNQGALAFELWTEKQAPLDIMWEAAQRALEIDKA